MADLALDDSGGIHRMGDPAMTPQAAITYLAITTAFIAAMAGFRIPDWHIVAECAVAVTEVPFVWFVALPVVVVIGLDSLAGRRSA
ncbi:hypothetical protein [Aeromicrobium sp. UC242_57]|uniref:hypothetical protein n=1 Tax=Aeromicrobium sp. UC242_57 TaxID=3374624 RepID=UPI0037954D86